MPKPAFVFVLLLGLVGCRDSPRVIVLNMSALELRNVVISGRGFEVRIAKIQPRESTSVLIRPRGESGIAIAFDAGGRHYAYPEQGYVEASREYRVRIIVRHDLSAEVSTMLLRD